MDNDEFPLTYRRIYIYQRKHKELVAKLKFANYHTKYVFGGGIFTQIICKEEKIVMPKLLQNYVVNWYHRSHRPIAN